jgi:hypothetical protein
MRRADDAVQFLGKLRYLAGQSSVLLEQAGVLLTERLVLDEYLRLARLVLREILGLGIAVGMERSIACLSRSAWRVCASRISGAA